jgi:hypothetical protein
MEMKKLVFILMLLAIGVLLSRAQLSLNNAPFAALLNRQSSAANYFLQENFEGPGYQNVWTISSTGAGSLNDTYNTSPAPLEALYSLRLNLSANTRRVTNVLNSSYSTLYGYLLINVQTVPSVGNTPIITFLSNSTPVFAISLFEVLTGAWSASMYDDAGVNRGFIAASNPGFEGVTNHFWFSLSTGTGANATYTIGRSADGIKPTSGTTFASTSSGSAVGTVNQIQIGTTNSASWRIIFDKIRLSTSPIGDNPP